MLTAPSGNPTRYARLRTRLSNGARSWSSGEPEAARLDSFALVRLPKAEIAAASVFACVNDCPVLSDCRRHYNRFVRLLLATERVLGRKKVVFRRWWSGDPRVLVVTD